MKDKERPSTSTYSDI